MRGTLLVLFWCLLAAVSSPSAQPTRMAASHAVSLSAKHASAAILKSVGGRLVAIHRAAAYWPAPGDHVVAVLDRDGRELFSRAPGFDIPDAKIASVMDATVTPGGTLVIAMDLVSKAGQPAHGLAFYDFQRATFLQFVRTSPVFCWALAADASSRLWCMGYEATKQVARRQDYSVIYGFSPTGQLTGEYVTRDTLPTSPVHHFSMIGSSSPGLFSRDGKVYVWLPGLEMMLESDTDRPEFNQISLSLLAHARQAPRDVAIGPGGIIVGLLPVLTTGRQVDWQRSFFRADRAANDWIPMATALAPLSNGSRLIGIDGSDLVLWFRDKKEVSWYPLAVQNRDA